MSTWLWAKLSNPLVERNACTGCMGEMVSTFIYLREAGFADRLADLTLVMGMPDELPAVAARSAPVVVGTLRLGSERCAECARAFRHRGVYVPGCPPHGTAIEALHDF